MSVEKQVIIGALLSLAISLIGVIVAPTVAARARKRTEVQAQEFRRLYQEAAQRQRNRSSYFNMTTEQFDELIHLGSLSFAQDAPPPSRDEIRKEVEATITTFRAKLEQIEQRFPEDATLEKISSVNDAILATKIEGLEKSIENLESRLLTKWDVATIVFAVFAAIGGIAGVIFAVANFVVK